MRRSHILALSVALGGALAAGAHLFAPQENSADRLAQFLDPGRDAQFACRGIKRSGIAAFLAPGARAATAAYAAENRPPLFKGLGNETIPAGTEHPAAQAYFDQGLKFAYGFNHAEALRAFRAAQAIDPACAPCFWGEALVLGPNINAPMETSATVPALKAITMAQTLSGQASPLHQALIGALAQRYSAAADADRSALDAAYADAMAAVADDFPGEDFVQVLAAEAMMDTQPWDYWQPGGATPKGRAGEAIRLVERVLARRPDHPGAIHLYIHLMEASVTPEKAEPFADRLAAQMPSAGHIVHMPAHLFYRIGRYRDSLTTNVQAIAADEAYFEQAGRDGIYGFGYYPHNVHFVLISAQMAGDGATAAAMSEKLAPLIPTELAMATPGFFQPIVIAPYYAYAQFGEPEALRALPEPDARLPFVRGGWLYARGMAAALTGDAAGAAQASAAMRDIARNEAAALVKAGLPAGDILEIGAHVLEGRLAVAAGDYEQAAAHFRAATEIEDRLPYMEPPFWYYPVRQSLGAALLLAGKPEEAVAVLHESLLKAPNNAYALHALALAEKARGNERAAKAAAKARDAAWAGEGAPDIKRM